MYFLPYFSITALVTDILLFVFFISKQYFPSKENKKFLTFCSSATVMAVVNLISILSINYAQKVPDWFNLAINTVYYLLIATTGLAYYMFLVEITNSNRKKIYRILNVVMHVMYAGIAISTFVNIFTGHLFYFDNHQYFHGKLLCTFYISTAFIILVGYIMSLSARKRLTIIQLIILYGTGPILAVCVIYQLFNPEVVSVDMGVTLMCMGLFETLQNPTELINANLGCFNERAFQKMIDNKISSKDEFTVMAFQLDGFEFVDRFLGVENGQELLANVCDEINDNIKGKIYHITGTRFAIISDKKSMEVKANSEWLFWRFLSSFVVNNVEVALTVRACAVNYPDTAESKDEIINAISYTFEENTHENDGELIWTTKERIKAYQRHTMITHILKRAILNHEFEVYYQPIYDVKHNGFRSSEALIRLKDPEIGFISPEEFIPIAEKNGLILEIGDIVFEKVCEFLSSGAAKELGIEFIEVNLSMVQCSQEGLHKHLIEIMDRYRLPYNMIDFEITETFDIKDNKALLKNMQELIDAGATFALDDFGTGFSNSNYLMQYPFMIVKLDKSFIWGAMENKDANIILKHSVAMIKELDKHIVAEGVETIEQARILIGLGCEYLQGYYFSPPISEERYVSYLTNQAEKIKEEFKKEAKL